LQRLTRLAHLLLQRRLRLTPLVGLGLRRAQPREVLLRRGRCRAALRLHRAQR